MSPRRQEQSASKKVNDDSVNVLSGPSSLDSSRPATGAIRRNRKQNKQQSASGRSHEENQERAYIAASRRSDRSIEARLESARRASEIHKKRCGRGLKVSEEAVMNEEMYEEEDPDYELRVNRLRMLMNYPPIGYHPYQWPLMPFNTGSPPDGGNSTPTTPAATQAQIPQFAQPLGSPTAGFVYPNTFSASQSLTINQNSMSSPTHHGQTYPSQVSQLTPTMSNLQTSSVPSTPTTHFLPPTQFPQAEKQDISISLAPSKPEEPLQIEIPEHEVVLNPAPLDLTLNWDGLDDLSAPCWDNSENFNMEEWVSQGL